MPVYTAACPITLPEWSDPDKAVATYLKAAAKVAEGDGESSRPSLNVYFKGTQLRVLVTGVNTADPTCVVLTTRDPIRGKLLQDIFGEDPGFEEGYLYVAFCFSPFDPHKATWIPGPVVAAVPLKTKEERGHLLEETRDRSEAAEAVSAAARQRVFEDAAGSET